MTADELRAFVCGLELIAAFGLGIIVGAIL